MRSQATIKVIIGEALLEPGSHEALLVVERADVGNDAESIEPLAVHLDRAKLEHVRAAVRAARGSRRAAARALGVDVRTVFRILGGARGS